MPEHTYKLIELVGSSKESMEDAVQTALNKASKSVRNMRWLQVSEIRGHIEEGKVSHWQVAVKIGFNVEE